MSIKREKFIDTLKPMFEVDKAELDFGVYKIINQKREQINDFLDMYYDRYTGLYLRSKTFLKNLEKV